MNNHRVVKGEHLAKSYQDGDVKVDILDDLNLTLEGLSKFNFSDVDAH